MMITGFIVEFDVSRSVEIPTSTLDNIAGVDTNAVPFHFIYVIFMVGSGAELGGSMAVTTTVRVSLLREMSIPTVVGVVGAFTPALHDDTMAAITTVIATIRMTAITGDTPRSSL